MPTGTTNTPAALYGPVSLVLGIAAVVGTAISGVVGIAVPILAGYFAITFGVLGLNSRANRTKCYIGLAGGAVSVTYMACLLISIGTSM